MIRIINGSPINLEFNDTSNEVRKLVIFDLPFNDDSSQVVVEIEILTIYQRDSAKPELHFHYYEDEDLEDLTNYTSDGHCKQWVKEKLHCVFNLTKTSLMTRNTTLILSL